MMKMRRKKKMVLRVIMEERLELGQKKEAKI